jgi:hypothetical protein
MLDIFFYSSSIVMLATNVLTSELIVYGSDTVGQSIITLPSAGGDEIPQTTKASYSFPVSTEAVHYFPWSPYLAVICISPEVPSITSNLMCAVNPAITLLLQL